MVIGMDILSKFYPFYFEFEHIVFHHNNFPIRISKCPFKDTLHSFFALKCVDCSNEQFLQWFKGEYVKYAQEIDQFSKQLQQYTSDNPLAF